MWSRPETKKVMTDSSESQAAAESGTVEVRTIAPGAAGVAVETSRIGGTAAGIHFNTHVIANPVENPVSPASRKTSSSSVRSAGIELQTPPEGGTGTCDGIVVNDGTTSHNTNTTNPESNYVAAVGITEVITSTALPPQSSSFHATTSSGEIGSERLTHPHPPSVSSTSVQENTTTTLPAETTTSTTMSGNSDYHSGPRSSVPLANTSSSSSSSRRQRNGLFGINLDLNFDPSSWLVPSNVAGRSISSLSVLPDWVRHPVSIIPNRGADNSSSHNNSGMSEGRHSQQHHHHHHHGSSTSGGGAASRLVSHHPEGGTDSSWNSSSFQTSSSIPSNMHHHHHHHHHQHPHNSNVPLRTRHTVVSSMRSVDEDLDADYNPVSTIDIGAAGRDNRGDAHSYVIDMDSPMGGWAEDDGPTSSQALRGASNSGINLSSSDAAHDNAANAAASGDIGGGSRRSISDLNLPHGGVPDPAQGMPGGGGNGPDGSPSMADAATGANERTRAAEILRDAPETRAFINEISRYTTIRPFIVINFLKGVFDHGTSILAFLALVVTFSHANSMVKKEVSKQRKRNLLYLTMIVVNLLACVAFIYYIFNEMELYYALVFLPTRSDLSAFWSLMWAVGVTDYVAKFGTVFVKIIVVSLPGCLLPFQKRGKFYLFVEYSSQLYRSFLPVYPWLFYLVSGYEGTARMFGLLLAGIYVIFKITDSVKRFKDWLKALEKLLSNVHYGTNPTTKQLVGAGTICPICHDNFANPTRLQCSHIFCEECVATWFDRERTCPMCRAKVVDDPTYRDGSTSQYIQLF